MKRLLALMPVLVIGAAALSLSTCSVNEDNSVPGYMEADLVLVGSEQGGRIERLSVREGDAVKAGDPVFALESSEQEAAVSAAKSRFAEAEARLADLRAEVQRPSEIEVLEAALARSRASLQKSETDLQRAKALFEKGWASNAQLDAAISQHDSDEAAVKEAERRIEAAKLPGRSDQIVAAAASVEAARHALEEAEKNLAKRKVMAPAGGSVEEVYFRPGEVVIAGQAVIALLPPQNLKVRFFVAEPIRAGLQIGQTVTIACDGCPPDLNARISFIAREAEFTPPVIFSREQREKLVFLVEARPDEAAARLTAGQPVSVTLGPPPQTVQR